MIRNEYFIRTRVYLVIYCKYFWINTKKRHGSFMLFAYCINQSESTCRDSDVDLMKKLASWIPRITALTQHVYISRNRQIVHTRFKWKHLLGSVTSERNSIFNITTDMYLFYRGVLHYTIHRHKGAKALMARHYQIKITSVPINLVHTRFIFLTIFRYWFDMKIEVSSKT